MPVRMPLEWEEQVLVREALAYMGRRLFDPRDTGPAGELEDWLDAALTRGSERGAIELPLREAHVRVLRRVFAAYAEALDHPSAAEENRARVRRLQQLERRLAGRSHWLGRLVRWLRGS